MVRNVENFIRTQNRILKIFNSFASIIKIDKIMTNRNLQKIATIHSVNVLAIALKERVRETGREREREKFIWNISNKDKPNKKKLASWP